jgi:hypothetical protein|tara:strand:+ start:581 stop:2041 length:1461 start_codon:yes stop_codon:yes gene_type:complete
MTTLTSEGQYTDEEAAQAILSQLEFQSASDYQAAIMAAKERFILISGGGRSGKSFIVVKKFWKKYVVDMRDHPEDGTGQRGSDPMRYWLIGESYGETEKEFQYLVDDLYAIFKNNEVDESKRVDPGQIVVTISGDEKPHLIIETKSAQDVRKMSKDGPHGIIMCEAGQQDFVVLERAQERLLEKDGWLMMPGTMEDSDGWFPTLIEQWEFGQDNRRSYRMPTYANKVLFPGGVDDPKIVQFRKDSSDDLFMERIEGRPVPPKGLVFPTFRPDVHIKAVQGDPTEIVYLWVDPGYSGSYYAVLAANVINGQARIFDEIYVKGKITEEICDIVVDRWWWKGGPRRLVPDIAVTQHQGMEPMAQVWLEKTGLVAFTNKVPIPAGIERVKSMLKMDEETLKPKLLIDPSCVGILSEFGFGVNPDTNRKQPYKWDTDRQGNKVGKVPKDANNDAIKALTYGFVDRFGYVKDTLRPHIPVKTRRRKKTPVVV